MFYVNSVGGNLAAISASRLSTMLHQNEGASLSASYENRPRKSFVSMFKETCQSFVQPTCKFVLIVLKKYIITILFYSHRKLFYRFLFDAFNGCADSLWLFVTIDQPRQRQHQGHYFVLLYFLSDCGHDSSKSFGNI